jgi:nitroreductase
MSILEIIRTRRSVGKMSDIVPSRAQIERLLEALVYAPNHHSVVASLKPAKPQVLDIENVEAVAAKEFLELEREDHLVAFVYLSYPAMPVAPRQPAPFSE